MKDEPEDQTERLIKTERRGIWFALIVVLALTAALAVPGQTRQALLTVVLPIGIVFGAAWVNRGTKYGASEVRSERRELVRHVELRLAAFGRSYKWAFFLILGELTTFCLLSATAGINLSGQMVAALAVATGVIAFLVCFLLFDRA